MLNKYKYVKVDDKNIRPGFVTIMASKDGESFSEVAYIDAKTGRTLFIDDNAVTDKSVKDLIDKIISTIRKDHPFSYEKLEEIARKIVKYEIEHNDPEDARGNLMQYGISDDAMVTLGFPKDIMEIMLKRTASVPEDPTDPMIQSFTPVLVIPYDIIASDGSQHLFKRNGDEYLYTEDKGIEKLSQDEKAAFMSKAKRPQYKVELIFDSVCNYEEWTVFRIFDIENEKYRYYADDGNSIREVRINISIPSDDKTMKGKYIVDFGGDFDGQTDDLLYDLSFTLL